MRSLIAVAALATTTLALTGCAGTGAAQSGSAPTEEKPAVTKVGEAKFEVTGTGGASVAYEDKERGKVNEKITLPWTKTVPITNADFMLWITVTGDRTADIACRATVDGKETDKQSAKKDTMQVFQCKAKTQ